MTGVMIQEDFAVTNVKSILLSLGKLLKKGWHLEKINPADAENSNNQHRNSQDNDAINITLWKLRNSCVLPKEQFGDPVSSL